MLKSYVKDEFKGNLDTALDQMRLDLVASTRSQDLSTVIKMFVEIRERHNDVLAKYPSPKSDEMIELLRKSRKEIEAMDALINKTLNVYELELKAALNG